MNPDQLNQRVALARQQGWSDARIQNALRNHASQQQAAPKKSPGLLAQLAPLLGSVGGGVVGGLTAGPFGVIAGGAAGGAAGEKYRQKASGEQQNIGNIVKEGAFGALGGLGEGIQALRGVGTIAKAGKVAEGAVEAGRAAKGIRVAEEAAQAGGVLGKAENVLRSGAKGIEQSTRQIRLPASVYGAGKEEAINATLDRLGFKGNASAQYKQLAPAMAKVEERIGQVAKANPNIRVNVNEIKTSFLNNLDSQLRTGELDVPTAQKEVTKYIGDLVKKAGSKDGELNLQQLRDVKKLVNKDYDLIAAKVEKGLPLTPQQKVAQVAWESLDGAVTKASPELKSLLTEQSHLYSAAPSLKAARVNPPTLRGMGSSLPVFATDAMRYAGAQSLKGAANVAGGAAGIAQKAGPSLGRAMNIGAAQVGANAIFGNGQQPQEQMQPQQDPMIGMQQASQIQPQQDQSQQQQQMFLMAMMEDMQKTGGKNLAKIQTIAQFADKMGGGAGSKLNTTQATQVSNFDNSLANLDEVESLVSQMGNSFGPVKGRLNSLNPYNETQANINQATLVAAQNIGRALEGGKLTDADIARYQKALPNINDTPQIAQDKINRLRKLITQQRQNYIQNSTGSTPDNSLISGLNGLLGS